MKAQGPRRIGYRLRLSNPLPIEKYQK